MSFSPSPSRERALTDLLSYGEQLSKLAKASLVKKSK